MQYVGEKHTTRDTAGLGGAEQDQGRAGQGSAGQGKARLLTMFTYLQLPVK